MSKKIISSATVDEIFTEWLSRQIGVCRWIVGRRSKERIKAGYERFITKRKFLALEDTFEKQGESIETFSRHLTAPNRDLEEKRRRTPPGMAFWAATGPAGKTCRKCTRWSADGWLASTDLLRDAPCGKYTSMMNGEVGPRLPHYTPACKYFEQSDRAPPIERPRGMRFNK